jgi:hypothetical protein
MGQFGTAQRKTVAMDLKTIETQLDLYLVHKGHLPSQTDGLNALLEAGIARELPKDPWGAPYQSLDALLDRPGQLLAGCFDCGPDPQVPGQRLYYLFGWASE